MKKILFFALTLWAFVVLGAYYLSYPFPLIPILLEIGLLTILLFLAICLGRKILRHFKVKFNSFFEENLFSIGLGLGIISYSVLGLGLLGLLYHWLFSILLVILTIFLSSEIKETLKGIWQRVTNISRERFTPLNITLGAIIIGVVLINLIGALAPSVPITSMSYDSSVYHLAVPNIYLQHQRIIPVSFNLYSNFPFTGEMLYLLALLLKCDILAKLIHFTFGILISLAIYSFSRRYFNPRIALLAAAIFYTIPYVALVSTMALVDLTLGFFSFLAIYALISYFHSKKFNWLILSGINCGLALGTKYTAWLLLFVILILGLFFKSLIEDRERIGISLKRVFIFAAIALAVASPWYLKNIAFTGNPIYPFLYKIFGGRYWSEFNAQRWMEHLRAQGLGYTNLRNYFKLPWVATMKTRFLGGGLIGPLFLIFLPGFLFLRKWDKNLRYLVVYGGGYSLFWALSQQFMRSLLPLLPALSIIFAYLIIQLSQKGRTVSRIIILVVGLTFCFNLFWIAIQSGYFDPLKVVVGLESRDEYLSRRT
ncbi:MAG TPA: phospholipid carrier-dependent glycosyltransferase, partial [bacterium]|nr:phospholipid carrier-dependent glycosyltransferase [bacterium]